MPPSRSARGFAGLRWLSAIGTLLTVLGARGSAQSGLVVQGIADAEFWSSDSSSNLLTRNHGYPGTVGRLTMWGAYTPGAGLFVYAEGQAEEGDARADSEHFEIYKDQLGLRYIRSDAFVIDIGKMPSLVGAFAARRFSTRNPLIGIPDGYPLQYPVGVEVSGSWNVFDYRMGAASLPVAHETYVPDPGTAYRPAGGFGITPMVGLRVGVSGTWGPYLNDSYTPAQLGGFDWQHYHQRIGAVDGEFSRGYLEFHGELARGGYDVPGRSDAIVGTTWYADVKYTLTPRLFVAARAERNDYPFIALVSPTVWLSSNTDFHDEEVGLGYRLTASTLVKTSYRFDKWVTPAARAFLGPGGHAFAVQLSQAFDVMGWIDRPE